MKIGLITNESIGVNLHRIYTPYKYLSKIHEVVMVNQITSSSEFDLIVFNRFPNQCITDLEILKSKGVKIIVDIDDWIELPSYHYNYSNLKIKQIAPLLDCLNLADVITTSTKLLQYELKKIGFKSEVLPNFIDTNVKNEPKKHAIGWVGGAGHVNNLLTMTKAMAHNYAAKRILGGYTNGEMQSEFYRKIMSSNGIYNVELRKPKKENYMELYKDITIGLLPCFKDKFSLCKSDLRALEYAAMGIVGVTNGGCYSETKAVQCITDRDIRNEIEKLIISNKYYNDMQSKQVEWFVHRNNIKKITQKRMQIIASL